MSELLPLLLPENLAPHWALLLILAAALTSAVTAAVDALREDGTLAALETEWLSEAAGVPVLK